MKLRSAATFLLAGFIAAGHLGAEPEELVKLRASYNSKLEEVAGASKKSLIEKLAAVEKGLAAASNLEEALKVREERVRLSLDDDPSASIRTDAGSLELERLAKIYNESLEPKVAPIHKTYVTALGALERKLSTAGRLDDAVAVKAEGARIAERIAPEAEPPRAEGPPKSRAELERYLTNSIWQLGTNRSFAGSTYYLALQSDGKAYYWGFEGTWSIDQAGEKLKLNSRKWGQGVDVKFADDFKSFEGTYLKDKTARFGRIVALRTR